MTQLTHQVPSSDSAMSQASTRVCDFFGLKKASKKDGTRTTNGRRCQWPAAENSVKYKQGACALNMLCSPCLIPSGRPQPQLPEGQYAADCHRFKLDFDSAEPPEKLCSGGVCPSPVGTSASRSSQPAPPLKQLNHKKRRRRRNRRVKSQTPAGVDAQLTAGCVAHSPTNSDLVVRSTPNPTIAFILSGNDDLSDAGSDWDDWDCSEDDMRHQQEFPLDVLVMPLLNGLFTVLADSNAAVRCQFADEVDGVTRRTVSPLVVNANKKWNTCYGSTTGKRSTRDSKVNFVVGEDLVKVIPADDIDRKGPWEQLALDRRRFQSRINSTECVLAPVLSPVHRQKVYQRICTVPPQLHLTETEC